jgi:hypothetical protein
MTVTNRNFVTWIINLILRKKEGARILQATHDLGIDKYEKAAFPQLTSKNPPKAPPLAALAHRRDCSNDDNTSVNTAATTVGVALLPGDREGSSRVSRCSRMSSRELRQHCKQSTIIIPGLIHSSSPVMRIQSTAKSHFQSINTK